MNVSLASQDWGQRPHRLLTMDEAWDAVRRGILETRKNSGSIPHSVGVEPVSLQDCPGRVLAHAIIADGDYPAFDRSMMDGFAVKSADCTAPGARLKIRGLIAAGPSSDISVNSGEAAQINTGAPIPTGANAVIRIEDCEISGDYVTLQTPVKSGQNIARKGGDRRKGDPILTPPLVLCPAHIAAAATAGASSLNVVGKVGVAIVTTGDELVQPGDARQEGQIYDSNGPMLGTLMRQFGASPRKPSFAPDEPAALTALLKDALACPIVLTVGGMSMGTHDLVPQALESLGVTWRFHGIQMRPGKPAAYGVGPNGQQMFGLPGNPVSAFVCAWLFVRMAIRGLQGFEPAPPATLRASLVHEIPAHRDGRPAYVPARVWSDKSKGVLTTTTAWSGSGDPFGLAEANALLYLPTPREATPADSTVEVILTADTID